MLVLLNVYRRYAVFFTHSINSYASVSLLVMVDYGVWVVLTTQTPNFLLNCVTHKFKRPLGCLEERLV